MRKSSSITLKRYAENLIPVIFSCAYRFLLNMQKHWDRHLEESIEK